MKKNNCKTLSFLLTALLTISAAIEIKAGSLRAQLVSQSTTGTSANNASPVAAASADGRYVVFQSDATNLVTGLTDTNNNADIFLFDSANNSIRCLSLSIAGGPKTGNALSAAPIISPNGRYIVFLSQATDLVASDTNGFDDIFRYDTVTNQTVMVSVRADGTQGGNGHSALSTGNYRRYDISDDGRYIVFTSIATNLTAQADTNAGLDIFVRDMVANSTTLVSSNPAGSAACTSAVAGLQTISLDASISSDGNVISYQSACNNLQTGITDGNLNYDVIVYNRPLNQNRYVANSTDTVNLPNYTPNGGSVAPVLSKSGNRILYMSAAPDVARPDNDTDTDIFVYDIGLRTNFLVSINGAGTNSGNNNSEPFGSLSAMSITPDGRYVLFQSQSSDLDSTVTDAGNSQDVFRRDLSTGITKMVSVNVAGTNPGNAGSFDAKKGASISDDGRFVTFQSTASTLVSENFAFDNNTHTYVRDMLLGNTFTASANMSGTAFGNNTDLSPEISRNGKFLTFISFATDLVPNGDTNTNSDIFRSRITAPQQAVSDFNGDGLTDYTVFRPSQGAWYVLNSDATFASYRLFGAATDTVVPADYTGDGRTDYAVFRPSNGNWYVSDGLTFAETITNFGLAGDKPIPQDYDGDGKADLGVYRPSTGTWWYRSSINGAQRATQWGVSSDIPVQGDFDGDGRADLAVFRPSEGNWYIRRSQNGAAMIVHFGSTGDRPVVADYDGDGKSDVAVYRGGVWYILRSLDGGVSITQFGLATDSPSPGSYDGDGRADIAVWRPSDGNWYVLRSASGSSLSALHFGQSGDLSVPGAYIP